MARFYCLTLNPSWYRSSHLYRQGQSALLPVFSLVRQGVLQSNIKPTSELQMNLDNGYTSTGEYYVKKLFCFASEKVSTVKGKHLLPTGASAFANRFLLE